MVTDVVIEVDRRNIVWLFERFDNGRHEIAAAGDWSKVFWGYHFRPSVPVHVRRSTWLSRRHRMLESVLLFVFRLLRL